MTFPGTVTTIDALFGGCYIGIMRLAGFLGILCSVSAWGSPVLFCRTADKTLLPYHQITMTPAEVGETEFTVRVVIRRDELGREIQNDLIEGTGEFEARRFYLEADGFSLRGKKQKNGNWKTDLTFGDLRQEMRCKLK